MPRKPHGSPSATLAGMETKTKWLLGGLAAAGVAYFAFRKRPATVDDALAFYNLAFYPDGQEDRFSTFVEAMPEAGKKYARTFWDVAKENKISPYFLAAIAAHESGFNPKQTHLNNNGTTDYGLMQINEDTLPDLNEGGKLKWDDPEDSILMGARHIRDAIDYMLRVWKPDFPVTAEQAKPLSKEEAFFLGILAHKKGNKGARKYYVIEKQDPFDHEYLQKVVQKLAAYRTMLNYKFLKPTFSITTRRGTIPLDIEVASTPLERAEGLKHRFVELRPDQGMLFVFPNAQYNTLFTMKDVYFSLDFIHFDDSGKVIHIHQNATPNQPDIYYSEIKKTTRYVLEVRGGFAFENDVQVGDRADFSDVKRLYP